MPKKEANDLKIAIKSCFTTLVEDTTLIQNAATPYPVEFAFSKDWDGFAKTAFFEAGGVSMAVVLSEDKCDIPGECLKKGDQCSEHRRLRQDDRGDCRDQHRPGVLLHQDPG